MGGVILENIKKLREMTGVGIGDCKKALQESNNDIEAAILVLRKRGEKISSSLKDKEVAEGNVFISISEDKKSAAILSLCCQTDFVARVEDTMSLGQEIVNLALEKKISTKEELLDAKLRSGETVLEAITRESGTMKENIKIVSFGFLLGGYVSSYMHHNKQIASLVLFDEVAEKEREAAHSLAIHIASSAPRVIHKEDLDEDFIKKELEVAMEKATASGKPVEVAEKIAKGMLEKSLSEIVLMLQKSSILENNEIVVSDFLKKHPSLKIKNFVRVSIK